SNRVQDRELDKFTFDLTYDNDLLEVDSISSQIGTSVTYTAPIVTNGVARLQVVLTGNNITIDSLLPLVTVRFKTYLTDTTLSTIELSAINLNDDNPDYKNCTLSATGNSTTFTQSSVCGDSSIRSFMKTGTLINIVSINPNPTKSDATITFDLAASGTLQVDVLDVLGNVVKQETLEARQGTTKHTITMSGAAEGVYYVRLRFAGETRTVKFIVE
ncbi:MAG TPA: T9SS type A sorting domain-containing protein, partial [Candidatus Kapabacteria bacterium]